MLVLKIPDGEFLMIYDRTDGSMPPITIRLVRENGQTRVKIDADQRYGIVRSDAKCKVQKSHGGKHDRPISA